MSEPTLKLPRAAEALLADFPVSEPDFETQAKAIEARLASASSHAALDDLLKAPELAPEPGEPGAPSSTRAASLPRGNFAEMARRSLQKKDDDEAAQLAKELLASAAQNRRPSQELVERVRAAGRAASTPLPVESVDEPVRPSGVVTRPGAPAATAAKKEPIHRGTIIGIAGTLVAVAACLALFLKSGASESPTAAAIAAATREASPAHAATPTATAASPAAVPNDVVSPDALPPVSRPVTSEAAKSAAKPLRADAVALKASGAPSSAEREAPVVLKEDPEPAKPPVAPAKPEPEPALKPAEGSSGGVPLTPSAGAVSTALGAVRAGAQACLAGQTEPVAATVTFAADGHVLRVSAGGPAGACIQAALSKARIAPFARETFSASTTVRPP